MSRKATGVKHWLGFKAKENPSASGTFATFCGVFDIVSYLCAGNAQIEYPTPDDRARLSKISTVLVLGTSLSARVRRVLLSPFPVYLALGFMM
jgi:hypothetical protein